MFYTLGEEYIVLTDLLPVERKQQGFIDGAVPAIMFGQLYGRVQ